MSFCLFSSRRRHTRFDCDWSSDVCSSDLSGGSDYGRLARQSGLILLGLSPISSFAPARAFSLFPIRFPRCSKRSEEHTSELQSQSNLVCRLLLEKKKKDHQITY